MEIWTVSPTISLSEGINCSSFLSITEKKGAFVYVLRKPPSEPSLWKELGRVGGHVNPLFTLSEAWMNPGNAMGRLGEGKNGVKENKQSWNMGNPLLWWRYRLWCKEPFLWSLRCVLMKFALTNGIEWEKGLKDGVFFMLGVRGASK